MKLFRNLLGPIKYFLFIGILSLLLAACHVKAAQSGNSSWVKEGQTQGVQEQEQQGNDVKAGASETKKAGFKHPEEDYILPDSDSHLYTLFELEVLSPEQVRLARNEIYARHGRRFKDDALQAYFQNKSWYEGTVDPDIFDDGLLNQIERGNITLLLRLEQELNGEMQEDENRTQVPPNAGYVHIVNKNQDIRMMILSTNEYIPDEEYISPQVINHGTYYEVTNGYIFGNGFYDISVMEGKGVGDTLLLNNTLYSIVRVEVMDLGNDEDVNLKYVSGPDSDYVLLRRRGGVTYYSPVVKTALLKRMSCIKAVCISARIV